jgi:hypothetical protein
MVDEHRGTQKHKDCESCDLHISPEVNLFRLIKSEVAWWGVGEKFLKRIIFYDIEHNH